MGATAFVYSHALSVAGAKLVCDVVHFTCSVDDRGKCYLRAI